MNSDSYFLMGHSHYVCEDYALTGRRNGFEYVIVSDGCSSSDDTDIGARILAKCAVDAIDVLFIPYGDHAEMKVIHHNIGQMTIRNAQKVVRSLGLPDKSLDATLLIAISIDGENGITYTTTFCYGDGVFAYKKNDKIFYRSIEYPSGAPYYLSYSLDKEREKLYFEEFGNKLIIHDENIESPVHTLIENFTLKFQICNAEYVAIMSDGVGTYHGGIETISDVDIINKMMSFKNHNGLFVKRRLISIERSLEKGVVHSDDVSMAAIYLGD